MLQVKFGWKPDSEDKRDFKYELHPEFKAAEALPTSVSLLSKMSPVENQGHLGSCVANATCGVLEFLQLNSPFNFGLYSDLSRLFVYFNARILDGDDPNHVIDNGTSIRNAILSIRQWGVCRETLWPYVETQVAVKPTQACFDEANDHKILSGYRVNVNLTDMKTCLASGYPFIFGVKVYQSFMSSTTAKTGIVPTPDPTKESYVGGHAMAAIGYDDSTSRFLVRNSWGSKWGQLGMCTIPYDYMTNPNLAGDLWTVRWA